MLNSLFISGFNQGESALQFTQDGSSLCLLHEPNYYNSPHHSPKCQDLDNKLYCDPSYIVPLLEKKKKMLTKNNPLNKEALQNTFWYKTEVSQSNYCLSFYVNQYTSIYALSPKLDCEPRGRNILSSLYQHSSQHYIQYK